MSSRILKRNQINFGLPIHIGSASEYGSFDEERVEDSQVCDECNAEKDYCTEEPKAKAEKLAEEIEQEAHRKAVDIIADAKRQYAETIKRAGDEAAAIKNDAEEEAKQKGYNQGLSDARQHCCDLLNEIEKIREQARAEYHKAFESMEGDILHMILGISAKVLENEISINPDILLSMIKNVLVRCSGRESMLIKVSAEDYDFLMESKDKLAASLENIGEFQIKKDTLLAKGSCIVESEYGIIDAGIGTKLEKITEEFSRMIYTPEDKEQGFINMVQNNN